MGPRGPRRLNVEFLEHLRRQCPIVSTQQRNRSPSLAGIGRVRADRVEQDVRVEEMQHY